MKKSATPKTAVSRGPGQLRIIAGEWRSRRLAFPEAPGLRPTPDRVRETLFNWLANWVPAARVIDPFVGSGALVLEALSRGASHALALDRSPQAITSLRQNLQLLQCDRAETLQTDALAFLNADNTEPPFDLAFLDPPFHQGFLEPACQLLENRQWLAERAWIYTESETAPSSLALPGNWQLHREKHTGQVYYALWQRQQQG